MRHAQLLQPVILEIPLHGVKLGHAVGNRRAGGKNYTAPACDFIHVPALGKHIAGFLRVRSGKARHIPHFCIEEQVFQPRLQRLFRAFQLLDGEPFPAAGLHLGDTLGDFPNLLMQQPLLAFLADGDFLELGVTHDDGVVVAGGNTGTELLAVVLLEVLFGCHQDVRGRVQTQELRSPLFGQVVGHHE